MRRIAGTHAQLRRFASSTSFSPLDPFQLEASFTEEERSIQSLARDYARSELLPGITHANRAELFDPKIMLEFGRLGLLGCTLPTQFGGAAVGYLSYGLVAKEIEYVDSAYRSALSVQSSLVCGPVFEFGSDSQRARYLPELTSGRMIGCFGLTEPDAGSDPGSMLTTARKDGDFYVLNGTKTWITNSPLAQVLVVWAKLEGEIRGFLLDRSEIRSGTLSMPRIAGKLSLRASTTGQIVMDEVRVDKSAMFTGVRGLRGPFSCLNRARFGIAFGALGAAQFCFDSALNYTLNRKQFGRPLAHTQLVQLKLADMVSEIGLGMTGAVRMARLMDSSTGADPSLISLMKRHNCGRATQIARVAREMLGANGVSDEYHVMRVANNLEAVSTYEGTADVHGLILGRAITGHPAF